jgi:hypothetical protein
MGGVDSWLAKNLVGVEKDTELVPARATSDDKTRSWSVLHSFRASARDAGKLAQLDFC